MSWEAASHRSNSCKQVNEALFRKEAMAATQRGWLGGISLAQKPHAWLLTAIGSLSALAVLLFLIFGSYTKRASVVGQLVPTLGLATVLSPATGVLDRLHLDEGDDVERGQPLAVVNIPRATASDEDTSQALEVSLERRRASLLSSGAANTDLLGAQESALRSQIGDAERELRQIASEIQTRVEQVNLAEETLGRLRQLEDERYVSLLQIKQQESSLLSWRAEMQALERQALATRRTQTQLVQALQEIPSQTRVKDADLQRELALLEQELVETQLRGAVSVRSPSDGMISSQLVKPGQSVQAGQPILSILPRGDALEAELLVPSRAIGFVETGDAVQLRYQAFPYQKFGHHRGTVAMVSRSAIIPGEYGTGRQATGQAEPMYRVVVRLETQSVMAYGQEEPLRPGMLFEADILGEKRRLIEWILEPIYSVRGRMSA